MTLIAGLFSKNWLPIVLGALVGLGLIVGAITLYEKGKKSAQAAQARAVIEAQQKADKLSAQLLAAQAQFKQQLAEQSQNIRERIVRVPVSTACRDSAAIGAAIDGIMQLLGGNKP